MTERERRRFAQLWGRRPTKKDPSFNGYANPEKLARYKSRFDDALHAVDHTTATALQAGFDYAVEMTRSEYRPLANRNWRTIQKFGVRLVRLGLALVVILLFLGFKTLHATNEIQDGRRTATITKCHEGQHALNKLKFEVTHIPDPVKRAEAELQLQPTRELLETLTGPIDLHDTDCTVALRRAGL